MAYSTPSPTQAGLWVAKEAGLFEKHGLTVDPVYIRDSRILTEALRRGEVAIALSGEVAAINAFLEGGDIVIVGGAVNVSPFQIWVRSGEIKTAEDLRGKTIGITRFGSASDISLRLALDKIALKPDKDVRIVQAGGPSDVFAALQSARIEAAVLLSTPETVAEKFRLKPFLDLGNIIGDYPTLNIISERSLPRKEPELIEKFLKAYTEGVLRLFQDQELAKRVISKYTGETKPLALNAAYDYAVRYIEKIPRPSVKGVEAVFRALAAKHVKAMTVRPDLLVDSRFYNQIEQSGFFKSILEGTAGPEVFRGFAGGTAAGGEAGGTGGGAEAGGGGFGEDVPEPRFFNAWFERDPFANLDPSILLLNHDYTLLFNVGQKREEAKREPVGEWQKEWGEKIEVEVSLVSPVIESETPTRKLTIPQQGESETLSFPLKAVKAGRSTLTMLISYKGNPISRIILNVRVLTLDDLALGLGERAFQRSETSTFAPENLEGVNELSEREYTVILQYEGDRLHVTLKGREGNPVTGETKLNRHSLKVRLEDFRHRLAELTRTKKMGKAKDALREFARIGAVVYGEIFEENSRIRAVMKEIRENSSVRVVQSPANPIKIVIEDGKEETYIPWSFLYDEDFSDDEIKKEGFWGYKYIIDYRPQGPAELFSIGSKIPNDRYTLDLFFARYSDDTAELSKPTNEQRQLLRPRSRTFKEIRKRDEFRKALEADHNRPAQVIYFYTHGTNGREVNSEGKTTFNPFKTAIMFGSREDEYLTPDDLQLLMQSRKYRELEGVLLKHHPIVFINACESAGVYTFYYGNFIEKFTRLGARGLIGTESEVEVSFANEFALAFFQEFLKAERGIGYILYDLRRGFLDNKANPMGFLYTYYGNPDVSLRYPVLMMNQ